MYARLGRAYVEQKQPEHALAALLRAQRTGPIDADTVLLLSTIENSQGAYDDAAQNSLALLGAGSLANDSQKGVAAGIAGLAYKNQKRTDDSIRMLHLANRLSPTPTSYLALAEIYQSIGKLPEAVKVLEAAHAAIPNSAAIAVALGRSLADAGDSRRAVDVLTPATRRWPDEREAWRWLAEASNAAGQEGPAIAALKELERRAPDYPMIHVMLAQAYLKQQPVDYKATLRLLDRAEKASPSDPDVYYLRGKIYVEQGRLEEAVAPLRRAIELAPTAAASYYQLGLVYRRLNRPSEAVQQFDRFHFFKGDTQ
jgi:tetratricopeptide (TPR) repeat protein